MSKGTYNHSHLRKGKIIVCPVCGVKIYRYPSQIKRNFRYCSKKCWYFVLSDEIKNNPEKMKSFERIRKLRKYGTKENKERMKKIVIDAWKNGKLKKRFGSDNNLWKGGISTEANRLRHSIEWKLWREAVFERDNYTCQKCGQIGKRLTPHHIYNFADYKELRFDISNGITFCEKCHRSFHKKYGRKNNTKEQIEQFLK